MVRGLVTTALVLVVAAVAQESSSSVEALSSGFLSLPDTLSQELEQAAKDGFWNGFTLASKVMLATGAIGVVIHLINRGAGR